MGRGPSTASKGDRMIRECDQCGSFFDLPARDHYLAELRNCLCFGESVDSASARAFPQRTGKKRRIKTRHGATPRHATPRHLRFQGDLPISV